MRLPVIDEHLDAERDRIARALRDGVEGEVRFGRHDRLLYATDASIYQVEPIGVVIPASIDDAARAVKLCAELGVAMLPRGGGTSLAGQCTARAVVLDLSAKCRAVLEVDGEAGTCRVEPGVVLDDLNASLAPTGWFFAPDPATSRQCNVGGCIGNNAAGARSIRFGRTSENLLGVDACLSDGRRVRLEEGAATHDPIARELTDRVVEVVRANSTLIRERFPRTIRRNAGYSLDLILNQLEKGEAHENVNLAHLLAGSEGTLAVTLDAELKLRRLPAARGLAVVAFESVEAAIEAVGPLLETGPTAVELLDDMVIDLALANTEYRQYVELLPRVGDGYPRAVLYVEHFAEHDVDELGAHFEAVRRVTGGRPMAAHSDKPSMDRAWKLRKASEPLLHGLPGKRKPATFVEDNAVPVERLGEFVREFREIVARHGTKAAYFAHASVGVLHVRPLLDISDDADRAHLREIAVEVADLAKRLGGVMSGEHGDGKARGPLLERFYGPELMGAFRQIKAIFDPRNLLNPGNIVEPGPVASITEHLRVEPEPGERRPVAPVETYFDYDDQHGFDGAVNMCNGAGVCRKSGGGTMCPSYMALLDERHTTRGRGNALRLAITGQLGDRDGPLWADPETLTTLDLCLSCKACKSECPSNVDVARLKAEYAAQSFKAGMHVPVSTRLFSRVHTLNRLGSRTPGLANAVNRLGMTKAILERVCGVDRRRSIPAFARPLTKRWGRDDPSLPADAPEVVLLADTFTTYNEPSVGLATRRVLEAFGYRVRLVPTADMARAAISLGLLTSAIREADAALESWQDLIDDESIAAFIVCEPSCLSSIKDDWLDLKLRTPRERRVLLAARSFLAEQFIAARWDDHPRRPEFRQPPGRILLHAHCHQKALWGADSSGAALRHAFPHKVAVLDTGCCGMAGSFGYTRARYDLSMAIGELSLFPAVREAGSDDRVVAPGISCRHQISDGTPAHATHPIEVLSEFIA
jgi:FAD/FMN-containing dehydrogenase/Fe-S oxidoreductase